MPQSSSSQIIGDPGIGKSALLGQFWEDLGEAIPQPIKLVGRCLAYGRGITFWALSEILKAEFGISERDSPEQIRRKLAKHPALSWTLGVDVPEGIHPLAMRDRLHQAWVDFIEELAADGPLVIVIEDMHWAEEPLLELLETVILDCHARVLVLVTGRPELSERHWVGNSTRSSAVTLELAPLPVEDAVSLAESILPPAAPPAMIEMVLAGADGNPLFLEELVATLIDQRILERTGETWIVRELPTGFALPDSIQAVIAARIDLLPPSEKTALQAASVIGRVFWSGPVYELLGAGEPDFRLLEERQFVGRLSTTSIPGQREFAFKHALTRQVAYNSLPKARRARLHAEFAEWLEAATDRDDHAALVAHHYTEAVRPDVIDLAWPAAADRLADLEGKAARWLQRAAVLAISRYAIDDGLALLERAAEFTLPKDVESDVWRAIGRAHAVRYEGVETLDAYERAAELAIDPTRRAEIYSELALETVNRYGMLNPMPTRQLVDGWIDSALEFAPRQSATRARALIARALWYQESDEAASEAIAISEHLPDSEIELRSYAYNARVLSAFAAGRYDESRDWAERRLTLADRISDPDHLVDIYSMPIPGLLGLARFEEARQYTELHDAAARRLSLTTRCMLSPCGLN